MFLQYGACWKLTTTDSERSRQQQHSSDGVGGFVKNRGIKKIFDIWT